MTILWEFDEKHPGQVCSFCGSLPKNILDKFALSAGVCRKNILDKLTLMGLRPGVQGGT
jgi:hypothetical protein